MTGRGGEEHSWRKRGEDAAAQRAALVERQAARTEERINRHFAELFTRLFGGGKAQLALVQADDRLAAGLEIMANPPGKRAAILDPAVRRRTGADRARAAVRGLSSNPRVQPGSPGYFEAAQQVRLLEVPVQLDRAMGDVHAAGNPHIQTDPRNLTTVAAALSARMQQLDPASAAAIAASSQSFKARWAAATQRWATQAAPLRGTPIATYHKYWVYLEEWLGLREIATIEPKPGVPPGSQYLAQLVAELPARGVRGILYTAYEDPRPSEFVAQRIGASAIMLPGTVGGSDRSTDLFGLFDDTIDRLVRGLGGAAHARQ